MTTHTDTIKALRDALTECLAAYRATNRNPETTMKAEAQLDRIRTANEQATKALALTADASEDAPDAVRTAVERRLPLIWDDANIEWGDAVGGPPVHVIFGHRVLSAVLDEIGIAARPAPTTAAPNTSKNRVETPESRMDIHFHGGAELARPAAVAATPAPEGWQLVPKVPTQEMADAFGDELDGACGSFFEWNRGGDEAYSAMLAAAPAAPIAEVTDLRVAVIAEAAMVCRNAANKYEARGQRSGIGWQVCVWLEREIRALDTQPAAEHTKPEPVEATTRIIGAVGEVGPLVGCGDGQTRIILEPPVIRKSRNTEPVAQAKLAEDEHDAFERWIFEGGEQEWSTRSIWRAGWQARGQQAGAVDVEDGHADRT